MKNQEEVERKVRIWNKVVDTGCENYDPKLVEGILFALNWVLSEKQ